MYKLTKMRYHSVIRHTLYIYFFKIKCMTENNIEQYLYHIRREHDIQDRRAPLTIAYPLAVNRSKSYKSKHYKIHAQIIYVAAYQRKSLDRRNDNNKISYNRRDQCNIKQYYGFCYLFIRP